MEILIIISLQVEIIYSAATNAMKAMQEKIKKLTTENEELKKNNTYLEEVLENVDYNKTIGKT